MGRPSVSVVLASHGRPDALSLCLTALGQLQYHPFEIVVVADAEGRAAAGRHTLSDRLKCVACDEENVSRARNLGIAHAAGDLVAFIDDDAIAEPDWLGHLVLPFDDPDVDAAGGYVIGRNGISLQWGARFVDREGWHNPVGLGSEDPVVPNAPEGAAVRTEGTNMAVRRTCLADSGGFDEAFRYYLDDTDLDMRLARAGSRIAFAPRARVLHGQRASARRTAGRTPRRLHEIGASLAAFLARHAEPDRIEAALSGHRASERARLLRHMVSGALMPGDVARLMRDFDDGARKGALRTPALGSGFGDPPPFVSLHDAPPASPRRCMHGWLWQKNSVGAEAETLASGGALVHLMRFTPSGLYHRLRYVEPGIWLQTGGLFGRSDRDGPLLRAARLEGRARSEAERGPLSRPVPFTPGN